MRDSWLILVSAGKGSRAGGTPKQFRELGGLPVYEWSLRAAAAAGIYGAVIVLPAEGGGVSREEIETASGWFDGGLSTASGGRERQDSVQSGLCLVPGSARVVLVHDAARPFAPPSLYREVAVAVGPGCPGAIPALEIRETVKKVSGQSVVSTVDRSELVAAQTPQAFDAETLRSAQNAWQGGIATDDAVMLESHGDRVKVVAGSEINFKITYEADWERALALVETGRISPVLPPAVGVADAVPGSIPREFGTGA